jgi:hypothetical protein
VIYCLHASITKLSHSHQAAASALLSTELSSFHTTQSKTRWPCGSESIQAMMMQPDQLRVTSWSSTFCSHKQQLLSELSLEHRSRTTAAHHRVSPRSETCPAFRPRLEMDRNDATMHASVASNVLWVYWKSVPPLLSHPVCIQFVVTSIGHCYIAEGDFNESVAA